MKAAGRLGVAVALSALLGLGGVATAWGQSGANTAAAPLAPVATLDLQRYLGTWHEIAKFPNWFQRKCVAQTRAEYSLLPDGLLRVNNRCQDKSGEQLQALGVARPVGGPGTARLEVRFAPDWLAFIPLVWANYWVIDIDADYQLAAISEPQRKYLWILSRTAQVAPETYQALLQRLAARGFDLSQLSTTPQP